MRTYNPLPSFDLFDTMNKRKNNKNFLGKTDRFKTLGGGNALPPTKYSVIQNWRGKTTEKL